MTTLLAMIHNVCDELTLIRPESVVGSSDQTALTLLVCAQREGTDLMRRHPWTILERTHTFDVSNGVTEYTLPSDFDRLLVRTFWDRDNDRRVAGPLDPEDWHTLQAGVVGTTGIGYRFRILRASSGNTRKIYLDPAPANSTDSLAFAYISNGWCASAGGTIQSAWAADTDVNVLDARLMELGIMVRYKRGRGLNFASEADEYRILYDQLVAQDRPAKPLLMTASRYDQHLVDAHNVPETGFGS